MLKRIISIFFLFFILSDLGYSVVQDLQMPLEGDMAEAILPANGYGKIFRDPLGLSVITKNAVYPNPNRFFIQWPYAVFFQHAPFIVQHFASPIDSVYYCCVIAKFFTRIALLLLIGYFIAGKQKLFSFEFLLALALITPLFQTNGYRSYMGIIDPSITYTLSYALPCAFLLLFYLPFFRLYFHGESLIRNRALQIFLLLFTFILCLSGPLNPGAVLVITLLFVSQKHFAQRTSGKERSLTGIGRTLQVIPRFVLICFALVSLLSLYSLYIGGHNSQFILEKIPLWARYKRLPEGAWQLLTEKIGYPLLIIICLANSWLIKKFPPGDEGKKISALLKWIGLFSMIYVVLLPLGGYRSYRPNIIRYDTIMPVTIALFIFYGISSIYLLRILSGNRLKIYAFSLFVISCIYTIADEPEMGKNDCEKAALRELALSKEKTVLLNCDCTVMAWEKIHEPESSKLNAQLLYYWGITKEKKLYYQH